MNFIIITCLVMFVSVLITHKLAGLLRLEIKLKPLMLCACCALLINFLLPTMPLAATQYHLLFVFGAILLFAFFIAHYNEKLVAASFTEPIADDKFSDAPCCVARLTVPVENAPVPPERPSVISVEMMAAAQLLEEMTTSHEIWMEEAADKPLGRCFRRAPRRLHAAVVKKRRPAASSAEAVALPVERIALDDILDCAEVQKQRRDYANAVASFKKALKLYATDDYAPFIIIELGNIYKNTGRYDEAIAVYAKADTLPSVRDNETLRGEFQTNITYLRIVKSVLQKHNCGRRAFAEIPPALIQEIEGEFAQWRSQKYAS